MRFKKYQGLALVVVLVIALAGCSEEATSPTWDSTVDVEAASVDSANFGLSADPLTVNAINDGWFFDTQPDYIVSSWAWLWSPYGAQGGLTGDWLHVTKAGDYVMTYETWYGVFSIMFRTTGPGTVFFWMQGNDTLHAWRVHKGIIGGDATVTYRKPGITVYEAVAYPAHTPPHFTITETTELFKTGWRVTNPLVGICWSIGNADSTCTPRNWYDLYATPIDPE